MEAGAGSDNGFAVVALLLGIAALVPLWGIAAVPFAVVLGALGRHRAARGAPHARHAAVGLALGVVAAVEQALFVLVVVL